MNEFGFLAKVKKKGFCLSSRILGKQSTLLRCPLIMALLLCDSHVQGFPPKAFLCALADSWFCFWKINLENKDLLFIDIHLMYFDLFLLFFLVNNSPQFFYNLGS